MQHADDKFDRRDPWPHVPFASDDAESLPALQEALYWIAGGAAFLSLCYLFLVAA